MTVIRGPWRKPAVRTVRATEHEYTLELGLTDEALDQVVRETIEQSRREVPDNVSPWPGPPTEH